MKIVKSPEESGLLIKGVCKKIENEAKKQKRGFLGMFLGTLGASLLQKLLIGKGTIRAVEGRIRTGQDLQCHFILKYKSIIKMKLNLMVFIQEIIYQK